MAGEEEQQTEPALFELETVVLAEPKRSRWRRYQGPALAVSTAHGPPLAQVTFFDDTHLVLTHTSGEPVLHIEQSEPSEFRFTDAADREIGHASAPRLFKSTQLKLSTAEGRQLLLARPGLPYSQWHLTETAPHENPAPEVLGRVTVSTVDSWIGLQQYVVETDPRLNAQDRRTVIAAVVCLHVLRRPPGAKASPA